MSIDVAVAGFAFTVTLALGTIIFHAGRMSARVDKLEEWRQEIRAEFAALHGHIERMQLNVHGVAHDSEGNGR